MTILDGKPSSTNSYGTAAEWWDALGNVPLDRIVFNPPPGSATEADVLRLDAQENRLCELVNGTLIEKTMGYEESAIAVQIVFLLKLFLASHKLGIVTGEAGMMRIAEDRVRIPDVAFVSFERLPGRKPPAEPIPDLAPDLAVEVLSESNTPREMQQKLEEYFAAGTRLVWNVDLKTRSVTAYTAPDRSTTLSGDQLLTGGEVLPGFSARVSELFEVA